MTLSLLLPAKGDGAEGGTLSNSPFSAKTTSPAGDDFQKFMGEAQGGQTPPVADKASSTTDEAPESPSGVPAKPSSQKPQVPSELSNFATMDLLLLLLGSPTQPEATPAKMATPGQATGEPAVGSIQTETKGQPGVPGIPNQVSAGALPVTDAKQVSLGGKLDLPGFIPVVPATAHTPAHGAETKVDSPPPKPSGIDPAKIAAPVPQPPTDSSSAEINGKNALPAHNQDLLSAAATEITGGRNPGTPPSTEAGTTVAINGQQVKSGAKKNEIAGSAAQKLPQGRESGPASNASASVEIAPVAKGHSDFSSFKDSPTQWTFVDTNAIGTNAPTITTNAAGAAATTNSRLDQVERLITREVVMVRQSGAEALAVSLKVDSKTSLFLQLTNHGGQIEASVRCESGDAGALNAHWGQLQESLSRQNIQLQPLEGGLSSSSTPFDHSPNTAGNSQENAKPEQSHSGPPPEKPSDDAMNAAVGLTKSKHHRPKSWHGWEKWA